MAGFLKKLFGKKTAEPAAPAEPVVEPAEPVAAPVKEKPVPWRSDMVPEEMGTGKRASYPGYECSTVHVRWVSPEKDENGQPLSVREPRPTTTKQMAYGFWAAGRPYVALKEMCVRWDDAGGWCWDKYGRQVLSVSERFPCFDSSDYLYEDRYYRWFFLWEGGKLTRVQRTDGHSMVTVTEDVADIETRCWERIKRHGCFQ